MLVCGPTLHENSLSPLQILVTGELVSSKLTQISFLIVTQSVWAEYNLKSKSIITNNDQLTFNLSQANIFEPFIPGPQQQPVLHGDIVKLYKEGGFKLEKISQQLTEDQKRVFPPRPEPQKPAQTPCHTQRLKESRHGQHTQSG